MSKNTTSAKKSEKKNTLVSVFIPKRFKDDDVRTVSVNGKYKTIPTGKHFLVEPCFAEAVHNALLADELAEKYISSVANN